MKGLTIWCLSVAPCVGTSTFQGLSSSLYNVHSIKQTSMILRHNHIRPFGTVPFIQQEKKKSTTAIEMSLSKLTSLMTSVSNSPIALFNMNLIILAATTALITMTTKLQAKKDKESLLDETSSSKPDSIKSLQNRFLPVFWLLRCADWLQGPYFYEVYSSKKFNGVPASLATVSRLFLTGFASTALFGPFVGRACDKRGRKRGTLAFAILYSLGAASTKSGLLWILLLGRLCSGIGTSLLFSAPEAWLVGETMKLEGGDKYLVETFGMVSGKHFEGG